MVKEEVVVVEVVVVLLVGVEVVVVVVLVPGVWDQGTRRSFRWVGHGAGLAPLVLEPSHTTHWPPAGGRAAGWMVGG